MRKVIDDALDMKLYPTVDHLQAFMAYLSQYAHESYCKLHWNHLLPMCTVSGDSFISTSRKKHHVRNSKHFAKKEHKLKFAPEEELRCLRHVHQHLSGQSTGGYKRQTHK